MKVLITGGCGFIGSAVIRHAIRNSAHDIINVDKLTYAAMPEALEEAAEDARYAFERVDICDFARLCHIFDRHDVDAVIHLAAESHVDRSIDGPDDFVTTNIIGTFQLLQAARQHFERLKGPRREAFRFLHVSTDEVFGALRPTDAPFCEASPYRPSSPYAASKAAADHLVRAWGRTYGLPVLISNCSNNYGPWQFPEKLVPLMILRALEGKTLPVYGRGDNVRDWLHVEDHATALWAVLERGRTGESYAIGAHAECRNIDMVRAICALMDERRPERAPHERLIQFVTDRPGHDFRYAIDSAKCHRELAWLPTRSLIEGLRATAEWYLANETWWRCMMARRYDGQRLGLVKQVAV